MSNSHAKKQMSHIERMKQRILQLERDLRDRKAHESRICTEVCAAIKSADDESMKDDYMLDSDDCIRVVREYFAALASKSDTRTP